MLNKLISFSLKYRVLILALYAILLVFGYQRITQTSVDVFPDLNKPNVTLLIEADGFAPEEVENLVVIPLENTINGATGVERTTSIAAVGYGVVKAEFGWDTDVFKARQIINEKIGQVSSYLPLGTKIVMTPISSIMGEVMFIGLTTKDNSTSPMKLREIAEIQIKKRLLSIEGVSSVSVIGGDVKQYQIILDAMQMQLLGVSLEDILSGLENSGINGTGGFLLMPYTEQLIRTVGRPNNINDLKNIVIKSNTSRKDIPAITLEQVADIKIAPETFKRGAAGINGQAGILIGISKQPDIDTIKLTKTLQTELEAIEKSLPNNIVLEKDIFKQSRFIQNAIDNISRALVEGAIFISIILFIFLLNFRGTFVVLTVIPVTLIMTAVMFNLFGLNINTMTLGGIAMALGSIVDDSIVDLSNIFKRLKENKLKGSPEKVLKVVYNASKEVRNPIVFSTVLIFLVFLPLFALGGIEGRIFTPLALAFVLSMISSFVVAVTLTPVLSSYLLPKVKSLGTKQDTFVVRYLKKGHAFLLNLFFKYSKTVLLGLCMVFIAGIILFCSFGKEFLPPFNEGNFNVTIATPPGTNLKESFRIGQLAETYLLEIPEVEATGRKQGRSELDEHSLDVNVHEIEVRLKSDLKRSKDEIIADIRNKLDFPGIVVNIGQPISHRIDFIISGIQAQIAVKIFGRNTEVLNQVTEKIEQIMKKNPDLVDVTRDMQVQIPQIQIKFDKEKAARYGVQIGSAVNVVEMALRGKTVFQIMENEFLYDVALLFSNDESSNIENIRNLPISTIHGTLIALGNVANVELVKAQNEIVRENSSRRTVVQANTKGRNQAKIINDLQKIFDEQIDLPQDMFIQIDGQYKTQQNASKNILLLGIISFLLMYGALYVNYRNLNLATQLMVGIPLSLIGGIIGVWMTSKVISVASIIGMVALVGVGIRNGILLMDLYTEKEKVNRKKLSVQEMIDMTQDRLEPVLMTTLTSVIGFIPLLIEGNTTGKEILYPVAVVMSYGLIMTTILNLLITPIIFKTFHPKTKDVLLEDE